MTEYDSFISHRHMAHDLARLQQIGLDAYRAELEEKIKILHTLLDGYNDCLLYTSPSPRDRQKSRMPSSAWKKKKEK